MSEVLESLRWHKFCVLDDGFITLVDLMGAERDILNAAKVSYGRDQRTENGEPLDSKEVTLLRYLLRMNHTSPFEQVELKFLVRVPMDTWRQWIRTRTANVNEYSTRYSVAIDSAQTTDRSGWRLQAEDNKQGSGGYLVPIDGSTSIADELSRQERELQDHARQVYQHRLNCGIAREQSRKDLPLSTYTEAYWKIDLHNLLHFCRLRCDSHSQLEIRTYANVLLHEIVKPIFPTVYQAFVDYRMEATTLSRLDKLVLREVNDQFRRGTKTFDVAFENAIDTLSFTELPDWDHSKRCRERDECYSKLSNLFGNNE